MKTWNLTKQIEVNLSAFIVHRSSPNDYLPDELLEKFVKDNFTLVKSGMYVPSLINGTYRAQWTNGSVILEYKPQVGKVLVNLAKSGKQHLYILDVK